MPNLMNMFWGMFAFIFGAFVCYMLVPIVNVFNNAMTVAESTMHLTVTVATWLFVVVMVFIIPLVTALSDDDDPMFKRIVSRVVKR